jgi:hypothetical protein
MRLREGVQKEDDHVFPCLVSFGQCSHGSHPQKRIQQVISQLSQDVQKKAQNHPKVEISIILIVLN